MNGAAGLLAEARVSSGVVEVEVVELKVFELVFGEAQFPRNICPLLHELIDLRLGQGYLL